ncbi:MAG: dihydrodipicolinate reductase [Desulfobacterales bacterium]
MMNPIKIMVNGAPGNMAAGLIRHAGMDRRFLLIPQSLTGPEIADREYLSDAGRISLVRPEQREEAIREIQKREGDFISIDFTHPSAVNDNAAFYCSHGLPFVMGTTGGDRDLLAETVKSSKNSAVIAPNMAKQIVGFQAMMEYAAEHFPGLFEGYSLEIRESHQKGKADTSGTAKAMVTYFNKLGCDFAAERIVKERDPDVQTKEWGIPQEYLKGHAWHTYTLLSDDGTVKFSFTHNVNGRDIYVRGTLDAVVFLAEKLRQGIKGKIFSMIDVLKKA